ncbi:MAG: Tom37 metaxin N-terminal-like domain-containing protein [Pseudomonadota bacterium]
MNEDHVILWQYAPAMGIPNGSPFCMKVEAWLKMAGIPYKAQSIAMAPKSNTKKAPYIEVSGGEYLADSTLIIEHLSKERGINLDGHLTDHQQSLATLIQRTFEEDIYFTMMHDRWLIDGNWKLLREAYFSHLPFPMSTIVPLMVRSQVKRDCWGQGGARLDADYRDRKTIAALRAIAETLDDKEFFFDEPSTLDATAFAFLANAKYLNVRMPSVALDFAAQEPRLSRLCEAFKARFWADWDWPKQG